MQSGVQYPTLQRQVGCSIGFPGPWAVLHTHRCRTHAWRTHAWRTHALCPLPQERVVICSAHVWLRVAWRCVRAHTRRSRSMPASGGSAAQPLRATQPSGSCFRLVEKLSMIHADAAWPVVRAVARLPHPVLARAVVVPAAICRDADTLRRCLCAVHRPAGSVVLAPHVVT